MESTGKACLILFAAVFSWPILGAFDVPATILGIPSFLAWLFLLWGGLVCALRSVSRRMEE